MRLLAAGVGAALSLLSGLVAVAATTDDPFLWLEETKGSRALKWVHAQNEHTLRALRSDSDYSETLADAATIVSTKDRLAYGNLAGGWVHNFWQDEKNRRGVWRRAPLHEYRAGNPSWETLLDLDAAANREGRALAWKGADCLPRNYARCLVKLSQGATTVAVREFDIATKSFLPGGFEVNEAKTDIAWVDADTVVIATSAVRDAATSRGTPRVVKLWRRGEPLRAAQTLYEGKPSDLAVTPMTSFDQFGRADIFIVRQVDAGSSEVLYADANGRVTRIMTPRELEFKGLHRRQMVFQLTRDWTLAGRTTARGAIVGFSLDDYIANGGILPAAKLLFAPEKRVTVTDVSIGRDAVYLAVLDNVRGRIHEVTFDGEQWFWRRLNMPDNGSAEIVSTSPTDGEVLIKYESFVTPDRLYLATKGTDPKLIKSLPERFDASVVDVAQYEAVSSDGARIPYFYVRRNDLRYGKDSPTLLYAYGGFRVSTTPWYWSSAGKLWLEKGGAYAVANVRGGGEFGDSWHEAAIRERRQASFDDLAAVARDMIARGFTSPRHLGVIGSSQGGLLATGTVVQNPALFNAVSAQVPLTDMLRYTRLAAGANWITEYGNPDDPRQRAAITRWSPYQNVRPGVNYPRVFLMTATRDDLGVHPAHARKMAAKLSAFGHDTLYFESADTSGTARQRAEELALTYTYFRQQLME